MNALFVFLGGGTRSVPRAMLDAWVAESRKGTKK